MLSRSLHCRSGRGRRAEGGRCSDEGFNDSDTDPGWPLHHRGGGSAERRAVACSHRILRCGGAAACADSHRRAHCFRRLPRVAAGSVPPLACAWEGMPACGPRRLFGGRIAATAAFHPGGLVTDQPDFIGTSYRPLKRNPCFGKPLLVSARPPAGGRRSDRRFRCPSNRNSRPDSWRDIAGDSPRRNRTAARRESPS